MCKIFSFEKKIFSVMAGKENDDTFPSLIINFLMFKLVSPI